MYIFTYTLSVKYKKVFALMIKILQISLTHLLYKFNILRLQTKIVNNMQSQDVCNCQRLNTALPFYPPAKICDIGVNTGIKRLGAFVSPGYDSVENTIGSERPARITFTRIFATLYVTRANHSVGDATVFFVSVLTCCSVYDRKRYFS